MNTVSCRRLCTILVILIALLPLSSAVQAATLDISVRLPVFSYSEAQTSLPKITGDVKIPAYPNFPGHITFPDETGGIFPVSPGIQTQVILPKVTSTVEIPLYQGAQIQTGPSPLYAYTKPDLGTLTVRTTPEGARIYIDGAYSGTAPLSLSRVYAGTHLLSITLPGYLTYTKVVRIQAGEETSVDAALFPIATKTPAVVIAPSPTGLSAVDQAIVKYTNLERTNRGLPALTWDSSLAAIAYAGSTDMKNRDFFSHINPDGHDPFWRIEHAGYKFVWAGENIAASNRISQDTDPDEVGRYFVQELWMNSPGHKANILNQHFTLIGVGTVYETDLTAFPYGFISTQLFTSKE